MISYVSCKWRESCLRRFAQPYLEKQRACFGAEIVTVTHPHSIFAAYEIGRSRARYDIVAYVHDDLSLLDPDVTARIVRYFERQPQLGILGVAGATHHYVPWWHKVKRRQVAGHWMKRVANDRLAYVWAGRDGWLHTKRLARGADPLDTYASMDRSQRWSGFREVSLLDGVLLVEHRRRLTVPWDTETYTGWHAYDYDRCMQAHASGLSVAVADILTLHHQRSTMLTWWRPLAVNIHALRRKWGLPIPWQSRLTCGRLY